MQVLTDGDRVEISVLWLAPRSRHWNWAGLGAAWSCGRPRRRRETFGLKSLCGNLKNRSSSAEADRRQTLTAWLKPCLDVNPKVATQTLKPGT